MKTIKLYISDEAKKAYTLDNDDVDIRKVLIECANTSHELSFDLIDKCLENIAVPIEDESNDVSKIKASYHVIICDDTIRIINTEDDTVNVVYFNSFTGNCVDKLLDYIIENDMQTLAFLKNTIKRKRQQRHLIADYHSSDMFENDFRLLSKMKSTAQDIVERINKFQEDLTINEYTKLNE